jgi:hypothetical protein
MNSIFCRRSVAPVALLLAIAVPAPIVLAQEEAPAEETGNRLGNIFLDIGTWVAQPSGLQYTPATRVDPTSPFATQTNLEIPHGTNDEAQYRVEYRLPSNMGSFEFRVYKHEDNSNLDGFSPAAFLFGEALTHNLYAGLNNDGLADAFRSRSRTKMREWRIDYRRQAFRTPRVAADWFVGWRRVKHSRDLRADYFALVPGLPVILPPACDLNCPDLSPESDFASTRSQFEGRGATAGIDLQFPLWKNEVVFEGGASISVLRGDLNSRYEALNTYYIETTGTGNFVRILCDTPSACAADYETFDDVFLDGTTVIYQAERIAQRDAAFAVQRANSAQTSLVIENHLGFRWRTPYKRLEVFGGFRQTRYDDVALELRPTVSALDPNSDGEVVLVTTGVNETERSVTYEGFFGGVTFRLY